METALAWIGLGIGFLASLISFFMAAFLLPGERSKEGRRIWSALGLGTVLVVVFFLLTVPKEPPFSPGQRLGWGFLLGGLGGLKIAWRASFLGGSRGRFWPYPSGFALSVVMVLISLVFLIFPGDPADALIGCALGIVVAAGVFRLMYAPPSLASDIEGREIPGRDFAAPVEAGAVLAVILAAGCALAVYHFHQSTQRGWWPFPLALAAFWLLGQGLAYFAGISRALNRYPLLLFAAAALLGTVLLLVLGGLLGARLEPAQSLWILLISGLITAALIVALASVGSTAEMRLPQALQATALAVLLITFLVVLTFKTLAGFGAAVALIAAWAIAGAALGLEGMTARLPVQALAVGANFLLLRLFLERAAVALSEVEMAPHYTLIGLLIGVLLPFVFSSLSLRAGAVRTVLLGGLGALSPLVMLTLWGPDAILGLLVGLIAAQALGLMFLPLRTISPQWSLWQAPTSLLALGMGLVAVQFSRPFAFLYELTRAQKAYLAGGIALLVIVWILAMGLGQLCRRMGEVKKELPAAAQEGEK